MFPAIVQIDGQVSSCGEVEVLANALSLYEALSRGKFSDIAPHLTVLLGPTVPEKTLCRLAGLLLAMERVLLEEAGEPFDSVRSQRCITLVTKLRRAKGVRRKCRGIKREGVSAW